MSAGLVTTYSNNNSNQYIEIQDEFYVPTASTGVFVSMSDFNLGCFYDHDLKKVYYNKYRDYSKPANSIYSNDAAVAQQQYTQNQITVNNIQYVSNIVNNQIVQNFTDAGFADPSAALQSINNDIMALQGTAATIQSMLNSEKVIDDDQTNKIWINSNAIAAQQIQINKLINVLKNLTILNISNGSLLQNLSNI